jgi:hypothetical protein
MFLKGYCTMAQIRPLERTLALNVAWNKARINFLAKFLIALIQVRTVNLAQIASVFSGKATLDSNYKRIQRFFRAFDLSYSCIARFVVKLLGEPAPWVISIDRTDWCLTTTPINILTLGICYKGAAFPLLWTLIERRGCSDDDQRLALLEEFDRLFGLQSIDFVCADREFGSKKLIAYLKKNQVDFRIRLRSYTLISNRRGEMVRATRLFSRYKIGEAVNLEGQRRVVGQQLYISGMKLKGGDYLIVASGEESPKAIEEYARRWEIETLFGCFKSRGFSLEATRLREAERLKKLIGLLALAFCWAHKTGEWISESKPLPIKQHGRKAKSIFRYGLDHLRRILCNLASATQQIAFRQVIQLLSCT